MKVLFVSLGCDKNLVDSEEMITLLSEAGHVLVDEEEEAEAVVVNTCCFIGDAKEESIRTILEMAELKKGSTLKTLIVTGCLAQRYRQEIVDEIPEVDAILGTASYGDILSALDAAAAGDRYSSFRNLSGLPKPVGSRILTTGGHYGYLKIAEGCDKHCTYCIIPTLRGAYRSLPMETLLAQAEAMVRGGTKELVLVAQETTLYGKDLYGEKSLHLLLRRLCKIPGLVWIRLLYCYPEEIYEDLIQTIKEEEKICHYLDIPIQHASDPILKRMGRRTTQEDLRRIISHLRESIPDIALRTTLISGFPGETQEDFEELYRFVNEMEFDRLGVFPYSPEEGTPAASMPDQIPEETKCFRRDELMELAQEISLEKGQEKIGKCFLALVEGKVADEPAYVARTYGDAPGVDGYVFIQTGEMLLTGDVVRVRITGAEEYDLIGVPEDEFTE